MEQQLSFADSEYCHKGYQNRKEKFLARMEQLVPWQKLESVIEPHYPKQGKGRQPYLLMITLRIHCLQPWYSLSDPSPEDALYEIASMRLFADLSRDKPIPDHTTVMNFHHPLERHDLGRKIFQEFNYWLTEAGVLLKEGTLIDAGLSKHPARLRTRPVNVILRCVRRTKPSG